MKQRLYVRIAKRPHGSLVQGSRFKIDAGPSHNPRPLEQGAYDDMALPVVRLEVKPGEGYVVEPTITQVELAQPASDEGGAT